MVNITKKGNALGFTEKGETVTGQYLPKRAAWFVAVYNESGRTSTADARNRNFASKQEASDYAQTLINAARTEELKWW